MTVNDADWGSGVSNFWRMGVELVSILPQSPSQAPSEKSKCMGSGGSMVARLKLEGIDGRAPQGVEPAAQFDSTRGNLPGPDIVRIDRRDELGGGVFRSSSTLSLLRALSRFYGWWCMAVRSWWVILSGLFR